MVRDDFNINSLEFKDPECSKHCLCMHIWQTWTRPREDFTMKRLDRFSRGWTDGGADKPTSLFQAQMRYFNVLHNF